MSNSDNQTVSDHHRIKELEAALLDCADYLKKLPVVPETLRHIRKIEKCLENEDKNSILRLNGGLHTEAGLAVVRINIVGQSATVSTDIPAKWEHRLWEVLTQGVDINLTQTKSY